MRLTQTIQIYFALDRMVKVDSSNNTVETRKKGTPSETYPIDTLLECYKFMLHGDKEHMEWLSAQTERFCADKLSLTKSDIEAYKKLIEHGDDQHRTVLSKTVDYFFGI